MSASSVLASAKAVPASQVCTAHPVWLAFVRSFVSADGRVIDTSTAANISTSEGQSYALFFALVNRDQARFDQLLRWTEDNLAAGDMRARLPAWSWGKADDGQWRVLDRNAASDSDVWIAYSLLAAGELWSNAQYRELGLALAARIIELESVELPGYGRVLLPGPTGFHPTEDSWRLNPSYWPISVLRGLALWTENSAWQDIVHSSEKLLRASAPRAVAPDWFVLNSATKAVSWPDQDSDGAYNAIRVYLWLGMMPFDDPLSASLRSHFAPWATRALAQGFVPERAQVQSAKVASSNQPIGFAQAALPYLQAQAEITDKAGLAAISAQAAQPREGYYTEVLTLFSTLWRDQRFQFKRDGRVHISAECL
ncbi:MAG: cellulose synthase complex periplasmic endoglucanase BcsZ [Paraperlucidibaca sp.]